MARDVTPLVVAPEISRLENSWQVAQGNQLISSNLATKQDALDEAMDEQINRSNIGVIVLNQNGEFHRFIPNERFLESYAEFGFTKARWRQIVMRR